MRRLSAVVLAGAVALGGASLAAPAHADCPSAVTCDFCDPGTQNCLCFTVTVDGHDYGPCMLRDAHR